MYNSESAARHQAANKYLPEQLALLEELFPGELVRQASQEEDIRQNTDCWVGQRRCMLRVGNYGKFENSVLFRFTLAVDEWREKVMAGLGDLFLYCWLDPSGGRIENYVLIDLVKLREFCQVHGTEPKPSPYQTDSSGWRQWWLSPKSRAAYVIAESFRYN